MATSTSLQRQVGPTAAICDAAGVFTHDRRAGSPDVNPGLYPLTDMAGAVSLNHDVCWRALHSVSVEARKMFQPAALEALEYIVQGGRAQKHLVGLEPLAHRGSQ